MLNKENILNTFETMIRKYSDFEIIVSNFYEFYFVWKKITENFSKSSSKMNYSKNYHTNISIINSENIENIHKIKNEIYKLNSTMKKHVFICQKFSIEIYKNINEIKKKLNFKEKCSIEKTLKLLENRFKNNKINNYSLENSQNCEVFKNLDVEIHNIIEEIEKHFLIITNFFKYNYISKIFNIKFKYDIESKHIKKTPWISNYRKYESDIPMKSIYLNKNNNIISSKYNNKNKDNINENNNSNNNQLKISYYKNKPDMTKKIFNKNKLSNYVQRNNSVNDIKERKIQSENNYSKERYDSVNKSILLSREIRK